MRIKSIWSELESQELCELPENEPWDVFVFAEKVKSSCAAAGPKMNDLSRRAKEASYDMITLFQERLSIVGIDKYNVANVPKIESTPGPAPGESNGQGEARARSAKMNNVLKNKALGRKEGADFDETLLAEFGEVCNELINVLHNKTKDMVLKCVKHSLDAIKKRLFHGRQHISYRYGPALACSSAKLSSYFYI